MTEFEDPFPEQPSYEEIQEIMPKNVEGGISNDNIKYWYNTAPLVAARIFVRVAVEESDFGDTLLEGGAILSDLKERDEESYQRIENLQLSMYQGQHAQSMAKSVYKKEYR
ncbi:MAG: hypothetical protein ABEH81_01240 [Halopenitus sp.]